MTISTTAQTAAMKIVGFKRPQPDNRFFAKALVSFGLFVFPSGDDKKPVVKWRSESTPDARKIDEWWARWPEALPAIDLAKSNLIVLDGDRHPNGDGVIKCDGVEAAERLFAEHGTDPVDVPTVTTPSDGRHYYFRQLDDGEPFGNGRGSLPDGIDVRGCGGYVIAPGARLRSGQAYGQDRRTPKILAAIKNGEIPPLPPWLAKILRPNGERNEADFANARGNGFRRSNGREQAYATAALDGCAAELASKPHAPSGRNELLNALAFRMGTMVARGWIDRSEVEAALFGAAAACGLVKDDGGKAVRATSKSGLDAGICEPHRELEDREPNEARPSHGDRKGGEGDSIKRGWSEPAQPPWPTMDEVAYYGLAGDIVRAIEPHTEADPVAILALTLVYFGNLIGRGPHYRVEATRHGTNLFALLVGKSSKARKGTGGDRVRSVAVIADEGWCEGRIKGGLSSGEGLISEVRDPVKKWDPKAKAFDEIDPGVVDKRLTVVEAEFAGALAVMERHGNTLSEVIRKAWDGARLSTLVKTSPLSATDPHISIVGHITEDELRARLTRTDAANGFGNRFLYVLVRRSKFLPFGGSLDPAVVWELGARLKEAAEWARQVGIISMTHATAAAWAAVYEELSADKPGLLGSITARAEAQVVRLMMVYALMNKEAQVSTEHLKAASAFWEYCAASAAHIFGSSLGDPVADELLQALQQAGGAGMSRTAISDLFGRNRTKDRIGAALALLLKRGKAKGEMQTTGGRAAEIWFALNPQATK
jgi:hypothetical protein